MKSEECAQKFHTDDVSLYPDLGGGASDWLKQVSLHNTQTSESTHWNRILLKR